jgi:toxin ParE1/3/4
VRVEFHPAAAEEFAAAVEDYEGALPELGRRFRDAVRTTIDRAVEHPEAGSLRRANTRHVIVSGFPFDLVYRVRGEVLDVLALAHHRRRPGYWQGRRGG